MKLYIYIIIFVTTIRDKIYGANAVWWSLADISSLLASPLNVELQIYPYCVVNLCQKTTLNREGREGCRMSRKINRGKC